jgi:apolipoprotein N-acyltransferase
MKRYQLILLALLSGLLLSIAWPLNGFPYFIFIALVPLLFIEDYIIKNSHNYSKFSVFFFAYLGFFTWNLLTTYWIWNSTVVGGILALLANSLLMTLVFHFYHYTRKVVFKRKKAYFALILYWIGFEYFHMDWDLSWPWLNLGNVFAIQPKLIQWYEFTGVFGGTLWILLCNILFFELFMLIKEHRKEKEIFQKQLLKTGLSLFLLLFIPVFISLYSYNTYKQKGKPVDVLVVQPNVDPYNEQYSTPPLEILAKMLSLPKEKLDSNAEFLIFPESALQENVWEDAFESSASVFEIRKFIKDYPKLAVIAGISSQRLLAENEPLTLAARELNGMEGRFYEPFNTALLIDHSGILQKYHKSKLTPGVEKMPFKKLFKPIEKLAINLGGTVGSLGTDTERKVFSSINGNKVSPIICYESIYGGFVAEFVRNGAELLFIITNDGWWGNTPGHRQHFSFASLRAIECRRDVARSANTGISGFVNQRGDVLQRTEYWKPDVIRQTMMANTEQTFYVKYGDYIGRIFLFTGILLLLLSFVRAIIKK